jgi:aryl-alcohol dehydrogenase-like predicted oxidoreductase
LKNLRIVEAMRPIATAHGVSVAAVAVRFILDRMNDSVVLVGAKRPAQICGSLEAMDWSLTDREMSALINISG